MPATMPKLYDFRRVTLLCLVCAFQCLGLFCFKKSSSVSFAAEISFPSFLWTLFLKTFNIALTIPIISQVLRYPKVVNIGKLARILASMATMVFHLFAEITIIIKGPVLCHIISECEEIKSKRKENMSRLSRRVFAMERMTTLLFYCSYTVSISLTLYAFWLNVGVSRLDICFILIKTILNKLRGMLTIIMFRKILTTVSERLSVDPSLDESLQRGSDAGPYLAALGREILKVSNVGKLQDGT